MTSPALNSFLPVAFRAFLYQACQADREIRGKLAQHASPASAEDVRAGLVTLLEQQKVDAQAQGRDPEATEFQQGQHVMAAVADAMFKSFEWPGRDAWCAAPLAGQYSAPDGVRPGLPAQIRQLLEAGNPDLELVQVYYLALATGAVAASDCEAETGGEAETGTDSTSSRRSLFKILKAAFPELAAEPEYLFPEPYRRHQRSGAAALLPAVRGWLVAVAVLLAVLLAVSAFLWLDATAPARDAVQQILAE